MPSIGKCKAVEGQWKVKERQWMASERQWEAKERRCLPSEGLHHGKAVEGQGNKGRERPMKGSEMAGAFHRKGSEKAVERQWKGQ